MILSPIAPANHPPPYRTAGHWSAKVHAETRSPPVSDRLKSRASLRRAKAKEKIASIGAEPTRRPPDNRYREQYGLSTRYSHT